MTCCTIPIFFLACLLLLICLAIPLFHLADLFSARRNSLIDRLFIPAGSLQDI